MGPDRPVWTGVSTFVASSHALSSLLCTAESAGPPPVSDIDMVEYQVAALVDAGRGLTDPSSRGFVGVAAAMSM